MKTAAMCLALLAAPLPVRAQPRKLVNAQVDTRPASAGFAAAIQALLAAQPQPAWIGYTVPAARGYSFGCDSWWQDGETSARGGTVHLEPPLEVLVLMRVEGNQPGRIRTLALDCDIDAGGVPVHWMTDVKPAESVAYLAVRAAGGERGESEALRALALHLDPAADAVLEGMVTADRPAPVRQRALHWLAGRNRRGFESVRRILASDPDASVRERAVTALSISREPDALAAVTGAAANDRNPKVRGAALGWLARQAGMKAAPVITRAIESDPEREVKRRGISALGQIPNHEGVPLLIQVARTSRDEDVRRQAMSALSHSKDARAVQFFEEVLAKR